MTTCQYTLNNGRKCKNPAVNGTNFCWIESHKPRRESIPIATKRQVSEKGKDWTGMITCRICNSYIWPGQEKEIDHSRSVSSGGTNHINNLNYVHKSCNRSKGTSSMSQARNRNGKNPKH